jgi:biotin carboxylase
MKQAFVLLESVNHMSLVLREAKSRGLAIVVLNHRPLQESGLYGVPRSLVDELVPIESWQDEPRIERIIQDVHQRYQVVGTYAGFEPTLPYEAMLRQLAGLPNNGMTTVRAILDKASVRKKLHAEGLSSLRSVLLREAEAWTTWQLDRPAVLKPVNGTGSALCFFVSSIPELHAAIEKVRAAAVNDPLMKEYIVARGEFVLEEKAEGELLSVESVVDRGTLHFMGLSSRYVLASDPVVEMGLTFPYPHPRLSEIVARSRAIHESLGVFHGATHLEVMVPEEGPIELIDFNVRFSGVESLICFNEAFDLRFEERLVDLACGRPPDLAPCARPLHYTAELMVLPPPGATEIHELVFPPECVSRRMNKAPGTKLSGRTDQLDLVGVCVIKAETTAELYPKAADVRRRIMFNGVPLGDNVNNIVACSKHMTA